ncbi:cytochrome P450 CYP82D47-like [Cucumis melo var. makuwa]|uniref:Cytochrome P450 CYP82D47-like n=1 Tax=Cucumis melo var. makuwa TaxID=1194695 RepID=A0A5A7TPU3_CUCMM|nr:cytochrome P450 CYP82D47-like [Cucumis melo var. makuwa]
MSLTTSWTMWMNTCDMKAEQATTNDSDESRNMSSFLSGFNETDVMFLEFAEELDNPSLVGDNSNKSNNGTSQPSTTPTPRRRAQS